MNLISLPKNQWQQVSFSKEKPKWRWEEGQITQQVISTGKKFPTGFALVTSIIADLNYLKCSFSPGNVYHSGIIFNYQDNQNFMLVVVNNLSTNYKGYQLLIGEVLKGEFSTVCLEKYKGRLEADSVLELIDMDGQLQIKLNDNEIFEWDKVGFDRQPKIGLYTQQNEDTQFFELETIIADNSTVDFPNQADSNSQVSNENLTIFPDQNPSMQYLKLKPPSSKSIVEFKRVFRVSLDSYYHNLYLNSKLAKSDSDQLTPSPTVTKTLDERPNRWYRELDHLLKVKRLLEFDYNRAITWLNELENDGAWPENKDRQQHMLEIESIRNQFLEAKKKLEALNSIKLDIEEEIRMSGYKIQYDESKIPEEIKALGYSFYIINNIGGQMDFKTIDFAGVDLGDDVKWSESTTQLKDKLFSNKNFKNSQKALFENELLELSNADDNQEIKELLSQLETQESTVNSSIQSIGRETPVLNDEALLWEKDKLYLDSHINSIGDISNYTIWDGKYEYNDPEVNIKKNIWAYLFTAHHALIPSDQNPVSQMEEGSDFTHHPLSRSYGLDKDLAGRESLWGNGYVLPLGYQMNIIKYDYLAIIRKYQNWLPDLGSQDSRSETEEVSLLALHYPEYEIDFFMYVNVYRLIYRVNKKRVWYDFRIKWEGSNSLREFFSKAREVCKKSRDFINAKLLSNSLAVEKLSAELESIKARIEDVRENELKKLRQAFLKEWNRRDIISSAQKGGNIIYPDTNPLNNLVLELEGTLADYSVINLEQRSEGFYSEDGRSIVDIAKNLSTNSNEDQIIICPVNDHQGRQLNEIKKAIINPFKSQSTRSLPKISFVETYQTEIYWNGYCLGELSNSINLFPGESKELVIEKKTAKSVKRTDKTEEELSSNQKTTDSLEEKLHDELSDKSHMERSDSSQQEQNRKNIVNTLVSKESSESSERKVSAEVKYGAGPFGASVDASQEQKSKTDRKDSRSEALELSQSNKAQIANKDQKEQLKKEISNNIQKTASEVSGQNKVIISSVTNENYDTSQEEKETIRIENPNIGKTVNYNFYQLQNIYQTQTFLSDVKIVIDPGIELLKDSELTNTRVFDIEEFGKIYSTLGELDSRNTLIAAMVARQVLKNYAKISPKFSIGNGCLRLASGEVIDDDKLMFLNLSKISKEKGESFEKLMIKNLHESLIYLKSKIFRFQASEFVPKNTETVNIGAYFMDSEVGYNPSTEPYLEERRDIETDLKRAELAHLKAQTEAGVFITNRNHNNE